MVVGRTTLELDIVEAADEVDQHVIALGGGPLDRVEAGHSLAQAVDLTVDHLVWNFGSGLFDLETEVLTQHGDRPDPDLELEGKRLTFCRRGVGYFDLRVPDRDHAGIEDRPLIPLGKRVLQGLLEYRSETEPLDDQRRRGLALAEAGQPHLAGKAASSTLDLDAHVFGRNFGLDPGTGIVKFCDGGLQGRLTLAIRAGSAFAAIGRQCREGPEKIDHEADQAARRPGDQPGPDRRPFD